MADPTRIYVWNHDAIEVVGDFELRDAKGGEFRQHGKVRLCRCGTSRVKPYCDNSHIRTGFRSEVNAKGD
jgi:CDGSH-type Zn-finger protein